MRFQQIVSAIQIRRFTEARQENTRYSWLARNLSQFVAGGYMTDGENPAIEYAQKLAFDDVERELMKEREAWEKAHPPKIEAENKPGSYEALIALMGQTRD